MSFFIRLQPRPEPAVSVSQDADVVDVELLIIVIRAPSGLRVDLLEPHKPDDFLFCTQQHVPARRHHI